VPKFRHLHQF